MGRRRLRARDTRGGRGGRARERWEEEEAGEGEEEPLEEHVPRLTRVASGGASGGEHLMRARQHACGGGGGAHSSQLLDRDHRVRVQLDRLGHHAERALAELAALVLAQLSIARGRPAQRDARC
eukprot:scaffold100612_cov42-Phaeocystis_antarctica.AAC.1